MATNLLIPPKFRAFDSNGDPLSGGLLYSYAAGTSTPLATYTTRAGSVANANPVVLDANGEANVWTTPGVDYKFELRSSAGVVQWTVDNVPSGESEDATSDSVATDPGGRLTLTSGTPVTTADIDSLTLYYAPYKSNKVPLYDGSAWALHSIASELSQTTADTTKSPAAVANNSNYDVFVWDDSGTLRLSRGPAWSSDTSRGTGAGTTELERIDGRYVNKVSISNGPAAQRGLYVGTVRSDGSATLNDKLAKRHVWNTYNRILRPMKVLETADTWAYATATYRQARASAANQLDLVIGLSEDAVRAEVRTNAGRDTNGSATVGIGVDSTSTAVAAGRTRWIANGALDVADYGVGATFVGYPGIGRHYIAWLEKGDGTNVTFYGDNGADLTYGLTGELLA